MELVSLYKWIAIITGCIFVVQFFLDLFGMDLDIDMDTGADGHDGASPLFSFLSVRNVVCFLLAFSVTGYYGITEYGMGIVATLLGVAAGFALVLFNVYLMRLMASLKRDTSVHEHEVAGKEGMVVFPVLASRAGQGKVSVTVDEKKMVLQALTDAPEDIPRDSVVLVEQVLEGWVLLVRRK